MSSILKGTFAALVASGVFGARMLPAQAPLPAVGAEVVPGVADEAEVLTRGPIHEAFAAPVGADPLPGPVVAARPPADVEELPPEVRPDDPSAQWIGGYWNWDDERNDFLWVTGVWRIPPPDRQWVPGYWTEVQGGFQRISGFWASTAAEEVVYYPQPPQSLETGPTSPQPGPDFFWVPGQWIYRDGRYLWQAGYWAATQPQYVWVPACYYWTPGGYIYTTGYWDVPPITRGCVFAPVYFRDHVYRRPNFYYAPTVLIRLEQVLVHLFARPAYRTYYFGDYYGPNYVNAGFVPWYGAAQRTRWYDPIYQAQFQRYGRNDPDWVRRYRERYDFFVANADARPRRTFAEQQRDLARVDQRLRDDLQLVSSIRDVANDPNFSVRLERIGDEQRRAAQERARSIEQFARRRLEVETTARIDAGPGTGPRAGDPRLNDPRNLDPRSVDPRSVDPRGVDPRGVDPRGSDPRGVRRDDSRAGPRGLTLKLPEVSAEARARAQARAAGSREPRPDGSRPDGSRPEGPAAQIPSTAGTPVPGAPGAERRGSVDPTDADPDVGRRPDRPGVPTVPGQAGRSGSPFIPPAVPGAGRTTPTDRDVRNPNDRPRPNDAGRPGDFGRPNEPGRPNLPGGTSLPGRPGSPPTTPPGTSTSPIPSPGTTVPGALPGAGERPDRPMPPGLGGRLPGNIGGRSGADRPGPQIGPRPIPGAPGSSTPGSSTPGSSTPGAPFDAGRGPARPTMPSAGGGFGAGRRPETGPPPSRPQETRPPETRRPEMRPPQSKPPEVRPPEARPPQSRPPENKFAPGGPRPDRGPAAERPHPGRSSVPDSKPDENRGGKKDDDKKKDKDKKEK